MFEVL